MSGARFKAWYIPQVPMKAFEVECATADEAQRVLDLLTDFSMFEADNRVKPDYSDAGGVVEWDETEQEWCDYDADDELRESIARGLAQSAAGEVVDLGDFSQYADERTS